MAGVAEGWPAAMVGVAVHRINGVGKSYAYQGVFRHIYVWIGGVFMP
jgi:hypothetical protein